MELPIGAGFQNLRCRTTRVSFVDTGETALLVLAGSFTSVKLQKFVIADNEVDKSHGENVNVLDSEVSSGRQQE
ncbi:hypothetical protein LguiA_034427 [Lonicera macranthoides]